MKRRKFLQHSIVATTLLLAEKSFAGTASSSLYSNSNSKNKPLKKNWKYLGTKDTSSIKKEKEFFCDVAVIGGGIAGLCAAVSSARHGAKTILIQNRPVLGGNASSEVHVPINGSYHFVNKFGVDRETGIVEEIQLENKFYNVQNSWEVW